jgi:hypothetical protein
LLERREESSSLPWSLGLFAVATTVSLLVDGRLDRGVPLLVGVGVGYQTVSGIAIAHVSGDGRTSGPEADA